jgi:hypothetical protein
MGRTYRLAQVAVTVLLCAGLLAGCAKKDSSQPGGPAIPGGIAPADSPAAAKEDPDVAAYFKKKGWLLMTDLRLSDLKPKVYLHVENREKPTEDTNLTSDDYREIAKSKSAQIVSLNKVKNTSDEGLKIIAGMPQLEGVIVGGEEVTDAGIKALAQCKSLDTVVLFGTKKVTDAGVKELAALPKLQALGLNFMTLDGSAFEAFAGSKTLQTVNLEYVDGLTDDGIKQLAKLPNLDELKIGKGFGESKMTAAGIRAIVAARLPAKFEFDKKLIDDDLLEALVKKGWLYGPTPAGTREKRPATAAEVQHIVLDGSKITDRGMQSILDCTNVASLHLQHTGITDETLKKLAALKKLDYLALDGAKVSGAGLSALAGLPLKHLALDQCQLTEDAFKAIGKITTLEELWLNETQMKPEWLKHIATLPKLKELGLRRGAFDDAAAKYMATLPSLENLTLNDTQLGDAGFQQLVKLPKLQSLLVDGTKVTKDVYVKAKKDHPKLRLYFYSYDQ